MGNSPSASVAPSRVTTTSKGHSGAPASTVAKAEDMGVYLTNVNTPGRLHVDTRDAVDQKLVQYYVDGKAETAAAHNIAECTGPPPPPTVDSLSRGEGLPFLGPAACEFRSAELLKFERARQEAANQTRYDDDINPRTYAAAQYEIPADMAHGASRMATVSVGGSKRPAMKLTTLKAIMDLGTVGAYAARGDPNSPLYDPILSSTNDAAPPVDIAGRFLEKEAELTAREIRLRYGPLSTMPTGNLTEADVAKLATLGIAQTL